jgi:hypothetical protein
MKNTTGITLLVGISLSCLLAAPYARGQACKDEEAIVADYRKPMSDLVATVKKESLEDFQKAFHQKSALAKLTLYGTVVGSLVSCLDKAIQDPNAIKEDVDAYKAKRETYTKLKDKIQNDRNALKAAEAPKDAKALIEKLDLGS